MRENKTKKEKKRKKNTRKMLPFRLIQIEIFLEIASAN